MTTKYCLNIIFKMKTYAQLEVNDTYEFSRNNLNFLSLHNTYDHFMKKTHSVLKTIRADAACKFQKNVSLTIQSVAAL